MEQGKLRRWLVPVVMIVSVVLMGCYLCRLQGEDRISDAKLKGLMDGKLFYVSQLQEKKDGMKNDIVQLSTVSFFAFFYISIARIRLVFARFYNHLKVS